MLEYTGRKIGKICKFNFRGALRPTQLWTIWSTCEHSAYSWWWSVIGIIPMEWPPNASTSNGQRAVSCNSICFLIRKPFINKREKLKDWVRKGHHNFVLPFFLRRSTSKIRKIIICSNIEVNISKQQISRKRRCTKRYRSPESFVYRLNVLVTTIVRNHWISSRCFNCRRAHGAPPDVLFVS